MRTFPLLAAAALLAACGSNAPPPPPPSADMATHDIPGMRMPAPTGNQDRDFARMMVVHHQGAIDMARKQLAQGKDPGLNRMAGEIIAAQEREIGQLNAFLDANGGR